MLSCPVLADTCPSGNNYGELLDASLSSLGITNCFYISNSGSDSNPGTKASPWLHAPGMPSFTGSHTPAAGEGFILRGGDSWHLTATGDSTGGTWAWTRTGTSSNPIYVGIDYTWFAGASWARPIVNGDNPTSTSAVGSCTRTGGMISINPASYVYFEGFEIVGFCWTAGPGSESDAFYIQGSGNNHTIVANMYFHGWTHTSGAGSNSGVAFGSYSGGGQAYGTTYRYIIVDGFDSDDLSLDGLGEGRDLYVLEYSVIRNMGGSNAPGGCYSIHDNLFENMNNGYGGIHADVLMCYGEFSGGASNPNTFYNNIFRHIGTKYGVALSGQSFWLFAPSSQTDYVFNNVIEDIVDQTNYLNFNQVGGPGGGNFLVFNNTFVNPPTSNSSCSGGLCASPGTVSGANNHYITPATSGIITQGPDTTPLYMTAATAAADGYALSNNYAPSSAASPTVGIGTNESSVCNGFPNTAAKNACLAGTTNGCTYNASSHTITCPALAINNRGTSWDVGAYQFQAISGPGLETVPPSLTFGNQNLNTSSPGQNVSLSNPGTSSATISNISLSGSGDYSETDNCGTLPAILAAGGSCTITVTFTPTVTGSRGGTVSVTDVPDSLTANTTLAGTGIDPSAINIIQAVACGPKTFPGTCTIAANGSGNTIVVAFSSYNSAGAACPGGVAGCAMTSVLDNAAGGSNEYQEVAGTKSIDTANSQTSWNDVWYSVASRAGATTITVTPNTSGTGDVFIWEVSNASSINQAGQLSSQLASTTPLSPSLTTTAAKTIILASLHPDAGCNGATGIHSGNPFTSDSLNDNMAWAHLITNNTGTYSAQWDTASCVYASSAAAFSQAVTNGGPWTTHTWVSPSGLIWGSVTWSAGHTWASPSSLSWN